MIDRVDGECNPGCAAAVPDIIAWVQQADPDLEALLQLFLDQEWPIRSIVVGCPQACGELSQDAHIVSADGAHTDAFLIRLPADQYDGSSSIVGHMPLRASRRTPGGVHVYTCEDLVLQARQLISDGPANDLLLWPAHTLNEMMTPRIDEFGFQAVAALSSGAFGRPHEDDFRKLRRSLFDRGLICIGSAQVAGRTALCFLTSAAVRSLHRCHVGSSGHVTMSELVNKAGFANQMFRYAYVKLYALRHGLTPAFPPWDGNQLFGLKDESCAQLSFRKLTFNGFTNHHRLLWDEHHPPIDIDLNGYFQEIPACWARHRPLLRRLFELAPDQQKAIDAWHHDATCGGRRTLVAIHVRRRDYRQLQYPEAPWFRLVPERWYLNWLRTIWPRLNDPLLFVATDEPDAVLPAFAEFDAISADFRPPAQRLPLHVRDFEILRRADYLAICNSSFSRMAAILASSVQKCFLPSFQNRCFVSYEPWIDDAFWERFKDTWQVRAATSQDGRHGAIIENSKNIFEVGLYDAATFYFDISDLLIYLQHHTTLSGIQRVQCEILSHVAESSRHAIRFVAINDVGGLAEIDKSVLLKIIGDFGSDAESKAQLAYKLRALLTGAKPTAIRPRDVFITIGAFWGVAGIGRLLQELKNSGVVIGVFIHDILPISAPEFFQARDTRVFVKGIVEVLTFADFVLTSSEYNKELLIKHMAAQGMAPLPVHLVPLAREIPGPVATDAKVSSVVAEFVRKEFVLCVGTIEVRKNPTYLFYIWKLMVQSGRTKIPTLVFAGRKGWLVQDFIDQLKACNFLDGKIVVLHDLTDAELNLLYRKCILTMFPSFAEGWGLPVGESLAHGKISICSDAGGISEVGGKLLDYLDPYNVRSGLELLSRYLDDPVLRQSREHEIGHHFEPRSWQKVTDDVLSATQALARQSPPCETVAAIMLPPNRFLPVRADVAAISIDGTDGALSAELACVSGWREPQTWGVQPDGRAPILRFRTGVPAGTRVNMIMRLAMPDSNCCRIRISSGCGAETETTVKGGADSLAVLSCKVERDRLITVRLSMPGPLLERDEPDPLLERDEVGEAPRWILKGLVYFEHKLADQTAKECTDSDAPQFQSTRSVTIPTIKPPGLPIGASGAKRFLLPQTAPWDDLQRATSFGAFLQATDSYWQSDFTNRRDAPIFADHTDRQMFYSGCGNHTVAPQVGEINDSIKLIRRSNQFVSMSRFTEGSIFDRSGAWKALGYLQTSPAEFTPWLTKAADGLWLDEQSLAAAHFHEKSCLIFYNGNLHNYYHWMVEGLLPLDILSRALGLDSKLKIALPKSRHIAELLDHLDSLKAVGLDRHDIVEIAENLIKVEEAIWVERDLIQSMPAPYVKDFQQRVAARHAGLRGPRNRRLFIARKGPTRTIHNMKQVQAFLATYEFETVYLEGKSVVDQILLFQSARFIVGAHGAGLSNLLFCEPGTKVIEFMPSVELRPFFWLISDKLDLVYGMQFCTPSGPHGFQSALTVDIDKLQRLFRMVDAHS
jgi:glycosyltransferase involved in cell wall biosynthesis